MIDPKIETDPIKPPERNPRAEKKRVYLNAVLQAFPSIGGSLATLLDAKNPPQSKLEREAWEERATNRINQNTNLIEEAINESPISIEGLPAELLITLLKDCPDGLCLKRYELPELLKMFPSQSQENIQDASYDLKHYGLLKVQPEINGLSVWLEEEAYEQVDHQIMGWNPMGDAVVLGKLMLEINEGTAFPLQDKLGWSKRRFNPAQRIIVNIVPEGCVRSACQADYVTIGVLITPESRSYLKQFIEENNT